MPSPSCSVWLGRAGRAFAPLRLQNASRASAMASLILFSVAVSLLGISSVTLYFASPPPCGSRGSKMLQ